MIHRERKSRRHFVAIFRLPILGLWQTAKGSDPWDTWPKGWLIFRPLQPTMASG